MDQMPTQAEIDELLSFLPRLYKEGFSPTTDDPCTRSAEGVVEITGPKYNELVLDFVNSASKDCWSDANYLVSKPQDIIGSKTAIESASVAELKSVITFFVRGERFCDGHWGVLIADGTIRRVLSRLSLIR